MWHVVGLCVYFEEVLDYSWYRADGDENILTPAALDVYVPNRTFSDDRL